MQAILCTVTLAAVLLGEMAVGELLVRRVLHARGEAAADWTLTRLLMTGIAAPLTNMLNIASAFWSFVVRGHLWRGITYKFGGAPRITVVDVAPLK